MKLLLTSNGLVNDSLKQALRDMLGRPTSECNFVFIPTAANGSVNDKTWLVHDIYNAHSLGWKHFDILDLAAKGKWDKKLWWPVIEAADVILVGGGNAGYLSYWMQRAGLLDALPELLKDKVYVGISAGSMMATAGLRVASDALRNTDEPYEVPLSIPHIPEGQISRKTLGFVDFLFRPHWGDTKKFGIVDEPTIRKAYAALKTPIYMVDDNTGLKVIDGRVEVVTEGK